MVKRFPFPHATMWVAPSSPEREREGKKKRAITKKGVFLKDRDHCLRSIPSRQFHGFRQGSKAGELGSPPHRCLLEGKKGKRDGKREEKA